MVLVSPEVKDLDTIASLMATGHIRSGVEDVYPLEHADNAPDRTAAVGSARWRGPSSSALFERDLQISVA
jgi:hypothetical protein